MSLGRWSTVFSTPYMVGVSTNSTSRTATPTAMAAAAASGVIRDQ
jgi:hypothetical protein